MLVKEIILLVASVLVSNYEHFLVSLLKALNDSITDLLCLFQNSFARKHWKLQNILTWTAMATPLAVCANSSVMLGLLEWEPPPLHALPLLRAQNGVTKNQFADLVKLVSFHQRLL